VTTLMPLVLGFLAVGAGAVVFLQRGRAAGLISLALVIPVAAVLAAIVDGREGVSQLAVGGLIGLPALVAAVLHRSRIQSAPSVRGSDGQR
jgi:hypothetical protein